MFAFYFFTLARNNHDQISVFHEEHKAASRRHTLQIKFKVYPTLTKKSSYTYCKTAYSNNIVAEMQNRFW